MSEDASVNGGKFLKSLPQWVTIAVTAGGMVAGYAKLTSRVENTENQLASQGESIKVHHVEAQTRHDSLMTTDRIFREKVIGDLAELKTNMALLLQERNRP